jgi:hypothetical protein
MIHVTRSLLENIIRVNPSRKKGVRTVPPKGEKAGSPYIVTWTFERRSITYLRRQQGKWRMGFCR